MKNTQHLNRFRMIQMNLSSIYQLCIDFIYVDALFQCLFKINARHTHTQKQNIEKRIQF